MGEELFYGVGDISKGGEEGTFKGTHWLSYGVGVFKLISRVVGLSIVLLDT